MQGVEDPGADDLGDTDRGQRIVAEADGQQEQDDGHDGQQDGHEEVAGAPHRGQCAEPERGASRHPGMVDPGAPGFPLGLLRGLRVGGRTGGGHSCTTFLRTSM